MRACIRVGVPLVHELVCVSYMRDQSEDSQVSKVTKFKEAHTFRVVPAIA